MNNHSAVSTLMCVYVAAMNVNLFLASRSSVWTSGWMSETTVRVINYWLFILQLVVLHKARLSHSMSTVVGCKVIRFRQPRRV